MAAIRGRVDTWRVPVAVPEPLSRLPDLTSPHVSVGMVESSTLQVFQLRKLATFVS
jgi:hypothetical protein